MNNEYIYNESNENNSNSINLTDAQITKALCNREFSWIEFNKRVLMEATFKSSPLFERLKFVSIFSTNLDEFFRVRVGSLLDYLTFDSDYVDNKSGLTAQEQLSTIYKSIRELYTSKDEIFKNLSIELEHNEIKRSNVYDLTPDELKYIDKYFKNSILPILSPQIIDNRHPFPHIDNKQLNLALFLSYKNGVVFGIIPIPTSLDRLIFLPFKEFKYVLLEDIIFYFSYQVFKNYKIVEQSIITVTRNADIDTDIGLLDEDIDYRQHMKKVIKKRAKLAPIRLEHSHSISADFTTYLQQKFKIIDKNAIYHSSTPLDLSYIFTLQSKIPLHKQSYLCKEPIKPALNPNLNLDTSIIKQVMGKDVLLSYPYESMQPFLNLMKEAADDPNVLSIKITLYRIASTSKLASYLIRACENKKDVTVLMELRARFDEENNIEWSGRLKDAGCNVIYGLDGYKVHSKICLITRKEQNKLTYITQVGTGNYNEKTAMLYTDLSLITSNRNIGEDANNFFKNMCLSQLNGSYNTLWVAPYSLKNNILNAIQNEINKAICKQPASVIMKLNSLTDKEIILKLIEAGKMGVEIKLIVRGMCCVVPNVLDVTDNITIISIVGRFLEHSRIYCFGTKEDFSLYISSADMMTRNTQRRVEIACPILNREIKNKIYNDLLLMFKDNQKARRLLSNGQYVIQENSTEEPFNVQEYFLEQAKSAKIIPVDTNNPVKKILSRFFWKK